MIQPCLDIVGKSKILACFCESVRSNVAAGAIMPESNPPSGIAFSPDVAMCDCESSFVDVAVAPTLARAGFGWESSVVLLAEPVIIEIVSLCYGACYNCGICAGDGCRPSLLSLFLYLLLKTEMAGMHLMSLSW